MRTVVIFDTKYGNTRKIAEAIGRRLDSAVLQAGEVDPESLFDYDLLVLGSPTHGGWYTEAVRDLLESPKVFEGKQVAVFDTRTVKWSWIFGSAAKRLARQLQKLGAVPVREPEAFFVNGMQGPLKEGELERARQWAAELVDQSGS
jgi:flavodoxin